MKKILILAGVCITMCLTSFAQDMQGQRQGGQRQRRSMDAVVDTAIINHMDLKAEVLQQVLTLQEAKQAQQREAMQQMRQNRNGQRMDEGERKAMQEKMQAFTAQYRKELREILGDETYIAYLEKMLDRQSMRMMGGGRPGGQGGQRGGQRQGGFQGGFPGGDGGFGGGNNF